MSAEWISPRQERLLLAFRRACPSVTASDAEVLVGLEAAVDEDKRKLDRLASLPSVKRLIDDVAARHAMTTKQLQTSRRAPRAVVDARCELAQRLRAEGLTLSEIAHILQRDHSTVLKTYLRDDGKVAA